MSSLVARALPITAADQWPTDSTKYKVRQGLVLAFYAIYLIYFIVTLVMFIRKSRDKHSGLSQRNVRVVVLQAVGGIIMGTGSMVSSALNAWPCFLKLWSLNIGLLIVYPAIAARAFQHVVVSNVHILTNKVASSNAPALKGTMTPHGKLDYLRPDDGPRHHRSGSQTSIFSNTDFEHNESTQGMMLNEKKHTIEIGSSKVGRHTSLTRMDNGPEAKLFRSLQKYTRLQRFATNRAMTIFVLGHVLVACILSLVINIVNTEFALVPMVVHCSMVWGFIPVIGISGVYFVFVLPVLLVKCWSLKDAYGIRNDLIASIIAGALCAIITVLWETAFNGLSITLSCWFFIWLLALVLHTFSMAVPLIGAFRHSRDVMSRMHGASGHGTALAAAIAGAGGED
ncbi:hypothetical protein GGI21_003410, partial [Coemansia aciculifera]